MIFEQAAILLLLAGQLVIFASDRFRMEVVALGGLCLGILLGIVPGETAFLGFANPAFVTVVEILLIVPVLGRSGLLDRLAARLPAETLGHTGVLALLCVITAAISAFMNNIGALALMIPVVSSVCQSARIDRRQVLMPVSFAALLGGLCSIIGTPANLLVSQQLAAQTGEGFAFFDIAYAGVPTAVAGLAAILWWSRKALALPHEKDQTATPSSRLVVSESQSLRGLPCAAWRQTHSPPASMRFAGMAGT
ncbi:SLC13 family permease [Chelativorans sp.]|uniref:SLC13 family permease n=1 Tax=Chelativorans sp. TaxID=2203393 RepID=UPI002812076F|nr:SLC13 family permease [Chelativorans sp.]